MKKPQVKVCGITRVEDGKTALSLGIKYLGFNNYKQSLRYISLPDYRMLDEALPDSFRIVVDVKPPLEKIEKFLETGFDIFQIHFAELQDFDYLDSLANLAGRERLWLAPKLPPDVLFPESLLQFADTFLIDTFQKDGFGGSGKAGDWTAFKRLKLDYPEVTWVLAGGLGPDNIRKAVAEAEPDIVDINSGVESAPGIKSTSKFRAFFEELATC